MNDDQEDGLALDTFEGVMNRGRDLGGTAYLDAGREFLFGYVWSRPGLDRRSRRWITITCACAAQTPIPIRVHIKAALESGDISVEEMREFNLQFAAYQGFAKGGELDVALSEVLQELGMEQG